MNFESPSAEAYGEGYEDAHKAIIADIEYVLALSTAVLKNSRSRVKPESLLDAIYHGLEAKLNVALKRELQ